MYQKGFTLIESVTVIILIGILAVAVFPKFAGRESYDPYAYRAQLISALRLTQQRAMQQTNTSCHHMVIEDTQYGIPDSDDCAVLVFAGNWQPDQTGFKVPSNSKVTFFINGIANPGEVTFDAMGRPGQNCNDAAIGCEIHIQGVEKTLKIQIEAQGYIHAL